MKSKESFKDTLKSPKTTKEDTTTNMKDAHVMRHPVDHGWAWVVLLGAMLNAFVMSGQLKSYSILYTGFLQEFKSSDTEKSLIQSIQTSVNSIGSIFSLTIGLRIMSGRQSVILGGVFLFLSYFCSSFARDIYTLYFSYSCLFGLAYAFGFSPSIVVLSSYFKKHRGLSNGLFMASGSLGALTVAPLTQYLIDEYFLKGALLVTSGLALNVIVAGSLMRPPSFYSNFKSGLSSRADEVSSAETVAQLREQKDTIVSINSNTKSKEITVSFNNKNLISQSENATFIQRKQQPTDKANIEKSTICSREQVHIDYSDDKLACDMSVESCDTRGNKRVTKKRQRCATSVKLAIKSVFNIKILKDKTFIRLLLAYSLGSGANILPIYYVPAYAMEHRIDDQAAALLVSVYGVFDIIGRTISGYVSDKKILKRQYIIAIGLTLNGVCQFFAPLCIKYIRLVIFCVIYGTFGGILSALYPAALLDIFQDNDFRSALCIMYMGQGMATAGTSSVVGVLRDVSGTYVYGFLFFGGLLFVSSSFLWMQTVTFFA